jgi:hypothetical protein
MNITVVVLLSLKAAIGRPVACLQRVYRYQRQRAQRARI